MTADTVPRLGNLPAEPNSFVGRERDLGDLALLLENVRALTLCGPGGIGKTRLATRLGWQLAGEFPDGVWLVEFADTTDAALVPARIAAALGVVEEADRPAVATLVDALRGRQLLLILDTCEHVVEAIADLARDLIAGCPRLRLVATSREPLRVRGETVWRVPPLSLPSPAMTALALPASADEAALDAAAAHEAVRLFLDRAAALRPGFTLTAENGPQIVQLCRTLDGVPLAIELAAARVRALSVEQIAARIDDRFRLLASGDRTAPPRQQTLLAAVDWSYELLTPDEQVLLRRLSVFTGWSLEMAEQVCADDLIGAERILDLLAALIDKSLVTLEEEVRGDARYRLLDTIREYAATRLAAAGEHDEFRRRHRDHLLHAIEAVVGKAFVRSGLPWSQQIELYHQIAAENLHAALVYSLDTADAEAGLRLCSALRSLWVVQGDVTEGLGWFARFLSLDAWVPARVRIRALMLGAELAFEHQEYALARQRADAAVAMWTVCRTACPAGGQRILALISLRAGRMEESLTLADAAVASAREYRDEWDEGLALVARAAILRVAQLLDAAQESYEAALELLTGNNGWGVAHALYGFGNLARARRDNAAALRHFRSALELFRQLGARTEMARCLAGIGRISLADGDLAAATASLAESLELSVATGQRLGIARGLEALAGLAAAREDDVTAVRLEGAATALRDSIGPRSAAVQARLDEQLAPAHQRLGQNAAVSLLAEGRRLSTHEAVRFALTAAAPPARERTPARADGGSPPGLPSGGGYVSASTAGNAAAAGSSSGNSGSSGGATAAPLGGSGALSGPAALIPASVLTARERQIALLIARGLSNKAIADELVISPATAARHVANILAKLGLSSRAQVAAWTVDQRAAGFSDPGAPR